MAVQVPCQSKKDDLETRKNFLIKAIQRTRMTCGVKKKKKRGNSFTKNNNINAKFIPIYLGAKLVHENI